MKDGKNRAQVALLIIKSIFLGLNYKLLLLILLLMIIFLALRKTEV